MDKNIKARDLLLWSLDRIIDFYNGRLSEDEIKELNKSHFPWKHYEAHLDSEGYTCGKNRMLVLNARKDLVDKQLEVIDNEIDFLKNELVTDISVARDHDDKRDILKKYHADLILLENDRRPLLEERVDLLMMIGFSDEK